MAAGIFGKIKKGLGNIISKFKPAINTIGKVIDKAKPIYGALKPFIPGNASDIIDKGIDYASKGLSIGKSLMDKV